MKSQAKQVEPFYAVDDPAILALPISDSDAIHATAPGVVLGPITTAKPTNEPYFKPGGLWYGVGREWLEWTRAESFHNEIGHIYRLHLDRSKMLVLRTVTELDEFNACYLRPRSGFHPVDWPEVMLAYTGIEIAPYQYSRRFDLSWYYSWDVASGCIWNPSAVLKVEELI